MNPLITFSVSAVRKAGNLILRYVDRLDRVYVERESTHNFVSEIDKLVSEKLVEEIHSRFPDHYILCEQSGSLQPRQPSKGKDSERFEWIIDPINGTHNFLHGHPHFAISIAIKKNNTLQHCVIYDPSRDEIFTASRGQGAHVNNRRIRVSGQYKLEQSTVITGDLAKSNRIRRIQLACIQKIMTQSGSSRISGSAALDMAYVACGRSEAFWQPQLQIWDCAAGSLLIREAGGFVADFNGQDTFLQTGNVITGNQHIFNDLLAIIKTNFKTGSSS